MCVCVFEAAVQYTHKSFEMRLCMGRRRLSFPLNIPMVLPPDFARFSSRSAFSLFPTELNRHSLCFAIHHSLRPLKLSLVSLYNACVV